MLADIRLRCPHCGEMVVTYADEPHRLSHHGNPKCPGSGEIVEPASTRRKKART